MARPLADMQLVRAMEELVPEGRQALDFATGNEPPLSVEVAVVGGGPAGASAAREAAQRGLSVLLFDPAQPRRKACGGGLTVKDLASFDAPPGVVSRPMEHIRFTRQGTSLTIKGAPGQLGKLIRRDAWDYYLYLRALEAGAVPVKERVTRLEPLPDGGHLLNGRYKSRYLIGADGVNNLTRRTFSTPIPSEHLWLAFGYYIQTRPADGSIEFILDRLPDQEGYLWVFPKADHLNVGICYPMHLGRAPLKRELDALVKERGWSRMHKTDFGALIPSAIDPAFFEAPVSGPDWVLCGDAAGHVNPIHGEGLYYAVTGGRLAARAVAEADPRRFERYWREAYEKDMGRAAKLKQRYLFKPWFQKLGFGLGRTRTMDRLLTSMCDGSFQGNAMRAFALRLPLAGLQALFKVGPRS